MKTRTLLATTLMLVVIVGISSPVNAIEPSKKAEALLDSVKDSEPGCTFAVDEEETVEHTCTIIASTVDGIDNPVVPDYLVLRLLGRVPAVPTSPTLPNPGGDGPALPTAGNVEGFVDYFVGTMGGGGVNKCTPGMVVCAMAGADSHQEALGNAPDAGVMLTMGGGQSGNVWGGYANVHTSLGSGICSFRAWEGCMMNWSDIRTHGCVPSWTMTDAHSSSIFFQKVDADYFDNLCEKI